MLGAPEKVAYNFKTLECVHKWDKRGMGKHKQV